VNVKLQLNDEDSNNEPHGSIELMATYERGREREGE
jgi:hypothetical protein